MARWRRVAAANNAEWCDVVCRSHGLPTHFDGDAWTSAARTPPLYPDAVTLAADAPAASVIARVDPSPGCSIKDSFCSLDLASYGFRVLFEAEWIVLDPAGAPATPAGATAWQVVGDPDQWAAWVAAWCDHGGEAGVLHPSLLGADAVTFAASVVGGRVAAGAIFNRSAEAVGISNLFTAAGEGPEGWRNCLALALALYPGRPLLGYESGEDLAAALAGGFAAAGPLRVWISEPAAASPRAPAPAGR